MSKSFFLQIESLEGLFDDPLEQATFARVWLSLGERFLTRCVGGRSGARDYVKLPVHDLALGLAQNWWTILYEPLRSTDLTPAQISRHRLDALTGGYVFPAVALWSGGSEAITVDSSAVQMLAPHVDRDLSPREQQIADLFRSAAPAKEKDLARVSFISERDERVSVARREVEDQLHLFLDTVVGWVNSDSLEDKTLQNSWARIVESINDPELRNYCMAAGRLGFDPYDEQTPEIGIFADRLPEDSFDDLCDAVSFDELEDASAWVARQQEKLESAHVLDMQAFGTRRMPDVTQPAWISGYSAAVTLRENLGLAQDSVQTTDQLFGRSAGSIITEAPPAVEGLVSRDGAQMRSLVVAKLPAQQRFRACRAAYLGWGADAGSFPLITTASTFKQQASRAFAAEVLCPADWLRSRIDRHGLTADRVSEIARELDCSTTVVERQARNHRIPLREIY